MLLTLCPINASLYFAVIAFVFIVGVVVVVLPADGRQQGIRIVKYYAWEAPFMERISSLRDQEVQKIKSFAFVNAYSMSIMLTTPFVMVMLTLVFYFNGGGDFSPDVVFTAVSLLLVIRFPLMMLPMSIAGWVQGKVAFCSSSFFRVPLVCVVGRDVVHGLFFVFVFGI